MDEMMKLLQNMLHEEKYIHSINVMKSAVELAERYGANSEDAALAGLLHDCAKEVADDEMLEQCSLFGINTDDVCLAKPNLLHGLIAAEFAREKFGVEDEHILNAIRTHTTGCENMTLLQKIIFLADFIEPCRDFQGVNELRELALKDIDDACLCALDRTIIYVLKRGRLLHLDTVKARNYLVAHPSQK